MTSALKSQWLALKRAKSGERFVKRYEASRRQRGGRHFVARVVRWVLALAAVAIAVVLMFIPGPAVVFFALAGALLASESRGVARFLDWAEVKLRRVLAWGKRHWQKLPPAGRVALAIASAGAGAAATFLGYRWITGA